MDTNSQPVNAARVWVAGPTWLRVKSQVKAGSSDKGGAGLVRGMMMVRFERRTTPIPTWLRVKSQIKAGGGKGTDGFGPGDDAGSIERRTTRVPTWLQVKSQVKAGAKALDFGPGPDDSLPASRPRPSWLLVKSQVKAGAKEILRGPGDDELPSRAFAQSASEFGA